TGEWLATTVDATQDSAVLRPVHRPVRRLLLAVIVCVALGRPLVAQIVETPIAFDSARRVLVVTPPLAARLRLAAPVWPVRSDFREARLYAVQPAGGFVLVVQRPDGVVERFAFDAAARAALGSAIDAAMRSSVRM